MIPILEAISNSVYAVPVAASAAPPVSGQRGPSGFASALVAAQGLSTRSAQPEAGETEGAGWPVAESAGAAANPNGRMLASWNLQFRKVLNSGSAAVGTVASGNLVVPEFISATASQIPSRPLQASFLQPGLVSTPTALAPLQVPDISPETIQPQLQTTAYDAAVPNAHFGYSPSTQTAGIFSGSTSPSETAGNAIDLESDLAPPSALISHVSSQVEAPETATASGAQSNSLSTGARAIGAVLPPVDSPNVLPNSTLGSQWNGSQDGLVPAEPELLAESTPPPGLLAPTGQPASDPGLLNVTQDDPGRTLVVNGYGLKAAESIPQGDQAGESTPHAPVLEANATEAGPQAEALRSSVTNPPIGQSNSGIPIATDTVVPIALSAQTGTVNPFSGIANGQISVSSISNLAAPLMPGMASLKVAAAKVAGTVTSPSVHGASQGEGTRPSILSSVSSTLSPGPDSGDGSPMANQTPFSIFFAGPGPGTESAASVLPNMILPLTASASRDSHATAASAPSESPQPSGSQSGVSQNAAPRSPKDSSVATESGSLQAIEPLRRDADLSAAGTQVATSQNPVVPVPAPLASTAVPQPVSVPATATPESLPKAGTLPGAASGSLASALPTAPQTPVVAIPGAVQMAQLVNRIGQSEMRIGMNTSAFGSVEVRTVVHANDVGLVIGSEKGDLRTLLANEMPAITNALQQQSLRLNSVNFMQGFAFSNSSSGGGGDSQQHSLVPTRPSAGSAISESGVDDSMEALPPAGEYGIRGSLSILA